MALATVRCPCGRIVIINGTGRATCARCGTVAVAQVEFIPAAAAAPAPSGSRKLST